MKYLAEVLYLDTDKCAKRIIHFKADKFSEINRLITEYNTSHNWIQAGPPVIKTVQNYT